MTNEHKAAMMRGRQKYNQRRRQEACERVCAFTAWLAAGSILRDIPCVPTDSDYAIAREMGKTR